MNTNQWNKLARFINEFVPMDVATDVKRGLKDYETRLKRFEEEGHWALVNSTHTMIMKTTDPRVFFLMCSMYDPPNGDHVQPFPDLEFISKPGASTFNIEYLGVITTLKDISDDNYVTIWVTEDCPLVVEVDHPNITVALAPRWNYDR